MEFTGVVASAEAAVWVVPVPRERLAEAASLAAQAWDVPPAPGRLEKILSDPGAITLVALDARDPAGPFVGVTTARLLSGRRAISEETVVDEQWRGHGVGRLLIAQMKRLLKASGVREVRGQSSGSRTRELAFFVREGFRVIDCRVAKNQEWVASGERVYETALLL